MLLLPDMHLHFMVIRLPKKMKVLMLIVLVHLNILLRLKRVKLVDLNYICEYIELKFRCCHKSLNEKKNLILGLTK